MTQIRSAVAAVASLGALVAFAVQGPVGDQQRAPDRAAAEGGPTFEISFADGVPTPPDGRVYAIVSTAEDPEPRFQIGIPGGTPFWGKNVNGLQDGDTVTVADGRGVYGYPLTKLRRLPEGDYWVQGFMNVYTTFHRSDGSTVKLHLPCGDGHDVFDSTGNLYSDPQRVHIGPGSSDPIQLELAHEIEPPTPVPDGGTCQQGNYPDTKHLRHVKIKSELLSAFWGHPMYIGANVLLPAGYDDPQNQHVRYPVEYNQGHFPGGGVHGFREDLSNDFSQWWVSQNAPRFISVTLRHENPFYDDSYAVNSANLGPYGDAITQELMPYLENEFRMIREPWAKLQSGGSTGGWESLAQQIFYPDQFGGTFSSCPDSVDFRSHQLVDVYDDDNAYFQIYEWDKVARPSARRVDGDVIWTTPDENHLELATGTKGRSGGQWDIWEAVFSPQAANGYPARVWNKKTGKINHAVAEQWAAFDLRRVLVDNWDTLGPKLAGKIHIYVGDDDTFYLNNAVEQLEVALNQLSDPRPDATILYGNNQPHCWSPYSTAELFQEMARYLERTAPAGADTASWQYRVAPAPKAQQQAQPQDQQRALAEDRSTGASGQRAWTRALDRHTDRR